MIEAIGIAKDFRVGSAAVTALAPTTLTLHPGESTAIVGPSGCGKTTLPTILGGLQPPDTGSVLLPGRDVSTMTDAQLSATRRENIGFVFQSFNLLEMLTVVENVALPLMLGGVSKARSLASARLSLEKVGLAELADRSPATLSGGQRQRVAIARAVTGDRNIVLADEPTGALDSTNGEQVVALLHSLATGGALCVIVTHDMDIANGADRLLLMRDGVIESDTRPASGSSRR